MNPWDLASDTLRIQKATAQLQRDWRQVRQAWRDASAEQFAHGYLEPILPHIRMLVSCVSELTETLAKARQACRDEEQ